MRRDFMPEQYKDSFSGSEFLRKDVSVVECIQDAKVAEMVLVYLYGVICKGKKVDSVMFLANPFNNDDLNMTFENIVNELKRREEEGNGDT